MKKEVCGTAVTARSIFYIYRRKAKALKHKTLLYGEYRKFIQDYHEMIVEECIENNFEYVAPCRLGTFKIAKKKLLYILDENDNIEKKYLIIDWKSTKEMWKKVPEKFGKKFIYYTNKHTGGYYFKWEWNKNTAAFHNMDFYMFTPTKYNRRKLSTKIMNTENYDAYEGVRKQLYFKK